MPPSGGEIFRARSIAISQKRVHSKTDAKRRIEDALMVGKLCRLIAMQATTIVTPFRTQPRRANQSIAMATELVANAIPRVARGHSMSPISLGRIVESRDYSDEHFKAFLASRGARGRTFRGV